MRRVVLSAVLTAAILAIPVAAVAQEAADPMLGRFGPAAANEAPAAPPAAAPSGAQTPAVGTTAQGSPLLPFPSMVPEPEAPAEGAADGETGVDRAYGAFQRGYFISALELAEPLANLGDPDAQALLGEIYLRGLGVARSETEAARWYRVAAEAGLAEAQFRYAMMLIAGSGVAADAAAARDLMQKAADGGNPLAAFNYGQMLIQDSPTGGFEAAAAYFQRAADAGIADGQYALAQLYAFGRGVPGPDEASARRWLREAAVKGHDTAQIELGIWMLNGRGGDVDPAGGFRWLKGAAERGNPIALNRVAHLYKDGIGTERDVAEAAKWVVLARRAQNADAELDGFFRALPQQEQQRALEAANRFRAS